MKFKFDLRLFDAGGAEAVQASADVEVQDTGSEQVGSTEEAIQSTADRQQEMLEEYADLDRKRMEQAEQQRVRLEVPLTASAAQHGNRRRTNRLPFGNRRQNISKRCIPISTSCRKFKIRCLHRSSLPKIKRRAFP